MAQHFVRRKVGRNGRSLYGFFSFRIRLSIAYGTARRLRNPCRHRVWSSVRSDLDPYPVCGCEGRGRPLPATKFVAHRCPAVVDTLRGETGSDDIDAVKRQHRDEQMALNPLGQLVPDRA